MLYKIFQLSRKPVLIQRMLNGFEAILEYNFFLNESIPAFHHSHMYILISVLAGRMVSLTQTIWVWPLLPLIMDHLALWMHMIQTLLLTTVMIWVSFTNWFITIDWQSDTKIRLSKSKDYHTRVFLIIGSKRPNINSE